MYENGKMRPIKTILMGGGETKENSEGVNLRYIVSTLVNVTMYPQYNNNMIIKKNPI
jgi:hypothetical protein